jgi:hypothetical protein
MNVICHKECRINNCCHQYAHKRDESCVKKCTTIENFYLHNNMIWRSCHEKALCIPITKSNLKIQTIKL